MGRENLRTRPCQATEALGNIGTPLREINWLSMPAPRRGSSNLDPDSAGHEKLGK
jgi:hypothetical protein